MTVTISTVSTATGAALLGMLTFGGLNNLVEPHGIVPQSLEFNGTDSITQERTVYAEETFSAVFKANIHATTNPDTPICSGGGGWPYRVGYVQVDIGVDEWVGDKGCMARLPRGTWLIGCAEWSWGEESVEMCTPRFKL